MDTRILIDIVADRQTLGIIFENKVLQKLKSKCVNGKKCAPKFIFQFLKHFISENDAQCIGF